MEAKHTHGSWHFDGWDSESLAWALVVDSRGNIIANVNTESGPDIPPLVSTKMPGEANARLIAAAPDLLDCLEEIANYRGGADGALNDEYVMDRVYAAIAKATGREV